MQANTPGLCWKAGILSRRLLCVVCEEESNCEQSAFEVGGGLLNSIKFIDCLLLLHDNKPTLRYLTLPTLFALLALLEVKATTTPTEQMGAST